MAAPARGRRRSRGYVWFAAGAVGLALFVGMLVTAAIRAPLPRIQDHWHAKYSIVICGRAEPALPFTSGNVHTHGDSLIHIHPAVPSEAGNNANLRRFFSSGGMTFTGNTIEFSDGRTYRNGDQCPDGTSGRIRLLVNGRANDAFERYVPRNGDVIAIQFD